MSKVVIYTTRFCPYCFRAKDLLSAKAIEFEEIAVDGAPDLRQKMMQLSNRHTVPQIFIDDRSIGGCDELYALNHSGELDQLLSDTKTTNS